MFKELDLKLVQRNESFTGDCKILSTQSSNKSQDHLIFVNTRFIHVHGERAQ